MKPKAPRTQACPAFTALVASAVLLLLLIAPGCSTTSAGGERTLKQTEMDVSWPMTRFRNACSAGRVTSGEQEQVNRAYAEFETAYNQALQAAHYDRNAPAPQNVTDLATKVIGAIQAISF